MARKPKGTIYSFTVEGTGEFPYDMLRYDQCWPDRGSDVAIMTDPDARQRKVRVSGLQEPTAGRWNSFGWTVDELAWR